MINHIDKHKHNIKKKSSFCTFFFAKKNAWFDELDLNTQMSPKVPTHPREI